MTWGMKVPYRWRSRRALARLGVQAIAGKVRMPSLGKRLPEWLADRNQWRKLKHRLSWRKWREKFSMISLISQSLHMTFRWALGLSHLSWTMGTWGQQNLQLGKKCLKAKERAWKVTCRLKTGKWLVRMNYSLQRKRDTFHQRSCPKRGSSPEL